jgi:hypothetical protein
MSTLAGRVRRALFGISLEETTFARRGFRGTHLATRARLESIPRAFAAGYHAALDTDRFEALVPRLQSEDPELRGFAYEGAALALALRDALGLWRRDRLTRFLQGPGDPHAYLAHVGAGWLLGRLPLSPRRVRTRLDPLLGWLAIDGYGFHEGFFHWPHYIQGQPAPARLTGYERRAFDQGLGRSLWFVDGAEVERLGHTIASFAEARRGDLWSGLGLAASYAGGVGEPELAGLKIAAGRFRPQLAQGAAFAAKARLRAGNVVPFTELAARVLCELTVQAAASVTDEALINLPGDGPEPAYEIWRRRVQDWFADR